MESRSGTKEEKALKMLWNNFKVAFAMYSKIPMPRADWNKENMKYTFCFFPFIGLVIGALSCLTGWIGSSFQFHPSFISTALVLLPVFVTGGIHVDGLLDTSDALSSWQEKERRLEILKDSHAGAFAVITACVYFLAWYGAYSQLWTNRPALWIMALGFMVSRCFSGISVMTFPKARKDGTVAEFSRKAEDLIVRNVLIVYLGILLLLMIWIQPVLGLLAFGTAILIFLYYHHKAMKYFGGITGDLAGYFLCLCEVGMAVVLAIASVWI
ncbi:adenosylcobinamide-GDP ribazoletransferase [Blautia sp. HCP3S3_H10_1]|uniref:adenosylcobinamide-GDP ribazoletransferase n=1 Tax=unclassified Blautia TaxID=2648079 RepID=UPI003F8EB779|nr:adenosylcobinamide-GDP ribazoletransferase [Clostridia bacterium]